ncbi:hypothetical protein D3C86_2042240 [compost metagenome]
MPEDEDGEEDGEDGEDAVAEEGHWGALCGWDLRLLRGCGLSPSALPGISPSRGEIDSRLGLDNLNV